MASTRKITHACRTCMSGFRCRSNNKLPLFVWELHQVECYGVFLSARHNNLILRYLAEQTTSNFPPSYAVRRSFRVHHEEGEFRCVASYLHCNGGVPCRVGVGQTMGQTCQTCHAVCRNALGFQARVSWATEQ